MEKYTVFKDQKNQYSENEYTTQSNLEKELTWRICTLSDLKTYYNV